MLVARWRESYDRVFDQQAAPAEAQAHPTLEVADDVREAFNRLQVAIDREVEEIVSDVRSAGGSAF